MQSLILVFSFSRNLLKFEIPLPYNALKCYKAHLQEAAWHLPWGLGRRASKWYYFNKGTFFEWSQEHAYLNAATWFVGNGLMKKIVWMRWFSREKKSKSNRNQSVLSRFPGLGSGTPLTVSSIELAYQELAWAASEVCLPASGCGEGSNHQEMTEQTKMRKKSKGIRTDMVSPHGRLLIDFEP